MPSPLEFHFDYASPWAYLANEIFSRKLPGVTPVLRPFYLRGLDSFSKGLPYSSSKLRYLGADFMRCAEHEGVAGGRFPSNFPINGLYALRGALVASALGKLPDFHNRVFAATWRDDRDVSRKEVVIEIAAEAGLDKQAFAAGIEDPAVKERLRADTAAAIERGVFGVPTFIVENELFWGHDRLDYVARALARRAV
jgi:2-hydroxychromene-2-carboxylate isomerase